MSIEKFETPFYLIKIMWEEMLTIIKLFNRLLTN